jgi:hypothetical protein
MEHIGWKYQEAIIKLILIHRVYKISIVTFFKNHLNFCKLG